MCARLYIKIEENSYTYNLELKEFLFFLINIIISVRSIGKSLSYKSLAKSTLSTSID